MNYIIIEAQTTNGVTTLTNPVVKETFNLAEQEFHTKVAAAAVSSVPLHSVTMLTESGRMVKYEAYTHGEEAAEE